jgi:alkanesulfonate monooxygenase SsuD/methylene tetrahydromethanopterin reductase-like flavin-dependent oxidoreductase (luciferase family)
MTIGVQLSNRDGRELVETIRRADELGVAAAWTPQGGVMPDTMVLLGAAAMITSRIKLGTSIVPTWPRAAILLAQQAMGMESLAPGRFRLGIGPSTPAAMGPLYDANYRKPLTQLREYLTVIRSFLHEGFIDFHGEFVGARVRLREPIDVPVMASALSAGAFKLCGEAADGAISWMCPWDYLKSTAMPAMEEGAEAAGREVPPLVAHVPICLSDDREEIRVAAQDQVGAYGTFPVYQAMFKAAGYPDTAEGFSDELVESLVASGSEDRIIERLGQMRREGAAEVMTHILFVGDDRDAYQDRAFELLARAQREIG